jgi:rod shape-determining protein MreD
MRNVAFLAFGFGLLVAQSALGVHVAMHPLTPNLLLPMAIFLGVQQDVHVLRGVLLSFALGYLLDEFCGSPIGLQTFVLVATFLVARGAGIRLFLRNSLFQIGLTFAAAVLAAGTILALSAIFAPPEAFPIEMPPSGWIGDVIEWATGADPDDAPRIGSVVGTTMTVLGSSVITALCAPAIFATVRRIDALGVRRREEGASAT